MTPTLNVATVQEALDALITADEPAATNRFTDDVALTGAGGCLAGCSIGLPAVLARFARLSHLTAGTFGTEVEAVYAGITSQFVVITRHWASIDGKAVHGTQALLVATRLDRISSITALSKVGGGSGIWD